MEKLFVKWEDIMLRLDEIDIPDNVVYGVPKGGMIAAGFLKYATNTHSIKRANIILDDLIDSGKTMERYAEQYPDKKFVALYDKRTENLPEWIVFPWENEHPGGMDTTEDNIIRILQFIGEDPSRPGLIDTPKRVVKMYAEIFRGYDLKQKPKPALFKNGEDGIQYNQMIIDEGNFYSHCEHHMVPFFGKYYFAYIPSPTGNIIGLSKVARLIDFHAAKLQIQERLVQDIITDIWQALCTDGAEPPIGMGLVMVGEHLCKTMRGVKKQGKMTTIELKGVFLDNPGVKSEFLSRCIL